MCGYCNVYSNNILPLLLLLLYCQCPRLKTFSGMIDIQYCIILYRNFHRGLIFTFFMSHAKIKAQCSQISPYTWQPVTMLLMCIYSTCMILLRYYTLLNGSSSWNLLQLVKDECIVCHAV